MEDCGVKGHLGEAKYRLFGIHYIHSSQQYPHREHTVHLALVLGISQNRNTIVFMFTFQLYL